LNRHNTSCHIQITKALPGRTDNAIKNRFNAACRNHALLVAAAVTAGSPGIEISLFDALHMHDAKCPTSDKILPMTSDTPLPELTADRPLPPHQIQTCQSRLNIPFHSPLGTRSLSPSQFHESSKHQRVDINAQHQLSQQQYMQHQLFKQQQQWQQQQQQQLQDQNLQQQEEHWQQEEKHLEQKHQFQELQRSQMALGRQRAVSMQIYPYITSFDQTPRTTSLSRIPSSHHAPQYEERTVNGDVDMVITPELFDRIALSNIPRPNPAVLTYNTAIKSESSSAADIILSRKSSQANLITTQKDDHNNRNGSHVYETAVAPRSNIVGTMGSNSHEDYMYNVNNATSVNNNRTIIDFDESIFEDWVSEDTELDFIDPGEDDNPSLYNILSSGCASSQAFCSGAAAAANSSSDYSMRQDNACVQNTNTICCGYPTNQSDNNRYYQQKQQSKQPSMLQQVAQSQHSPQSNGTQKTKPLGFGHSIRALKGKFCGTGNVDNSFNPSDNYSYDTKSNPIERQVVTKQDAYRTTSSSAGSSVLISKYGQNALREQYANSKKHDINRSGMTADTSYSLGTNQDKQIRRTYGSSYVMPPCSQNLGRPSLAPYLDPPAFYTGSDPGRDNTQ
jgi:hypothetical protein